MPEEPPLPVLWTRMVMTFAASAALLAGPAWAQLGALPQSLVRKTGVLTAAETSQVKDFIDPLLADLANPEADVRSRARAGLIEPLKTAGVSVAFQQAYSTALSGPLSNLVSDENVAVRIAALEISGWLGTVDGWQLVSPQMDADQPGIRLAACVAARSILTAAGSRSPAINAASTGSVVDSVSHRLAEETDPFVADGLVRTLLQAGQLVDVSGYEAVGRKAWRELSKHLPTRVFESREQDDFAAAQTKLTALGTLEFFRTPGGLARAVGGVDPSIVKASASISGEMMAMVAAQAKAHPDEPLDDEMVRMGRMAFSVLTLASRQSSKTAPDAKLASPDQTSGAEYFRDARTYVLSLVQQYQVPAERMSRWFN